VETAKRLVGEFGGTAYAAFAALQLAQLSYTQGEKDAARAHLQWAMDNAPDKALAELARLRLAQLLIDMQQWDEASALVAGAGEMMAGDFAVLRGDIARQQGDADAARAAYREALDKGVHNAELVRMKLVDSGDGRTDS
jgi:predicted negative regulator of RcsB-dependent stress response